MHSTQYTVQGLLSVATKETFADIEFSTISRVLHHSGRQGQGKGQGKEQKEQNKEKCEVQENAKIK